MKRILLIAPACYPVFGAEAIVNIKMLQAMTSSGEFEVDLVSKKSKWEDYPFDPIEKLGVKLHSLHVIEVDNKFNLRTLWGHFLSLILFGVVFKGSHWAAKAFPIIKRLVKSNNYDYVLTKDAPSFLLGYYLKRQLGLQWIATWNDPYPTIKYPYPYNVAFHAKNSLFDNKIIKIMSMADKHVFPSDRLSLYMQKYLSISNDNISIIPHVSLSNALISDTELDSSILQIVHSGNIKYPRDPKPFFEALSKYIKANPNSKILVSILGATDGDIRRDIECFHLGKNVKLLPSVSYRESIELLTHYHVAIIVEADCAEGIFLPTKVSDFMQCKKPIFAISPKVGVLNDLYVNGYISYFAPISDTSAIENEIGKLYEDFVAGKLSIHPLTNPQYTQESMVKQYLKF